MKPGDVVMISGAASGIGRHMAIRLHARGARLMLLDFDGERLASLANEQGWHADERVLVRALDVRDHGGWQTVLADTLARFGRVDYLLNVAGILHSGYVHESPVEPLIAQLDVNVRGVIYATSVVSRQMVRQGSGHIINVASIAGISHVPGLAAYCASKHAVRGFSLSVAHELRPHGVSVSVICPDAVETPMLKQQEGSPAAAMTFGARRALSLLEVEQAFLEVMRTRALERVVDVRGTARALAAKVGNAFPSLAQIALGTIVKRGLAMQRKRTA